MTEAAAAPQTERKKIIFSAIQPTGVFTLGNYIGAVRNWGKLQEDYDCLYCVADLHAITVRQEPAALRKRTLEAYALLMACGIDPERSILFIQSHNPHHTGMSWVLNCFTQFGELSRMTQFKDKSARYANDVNAGLFTYPVLMATDILLYQTDYVPVGEDQRQHLEITRDIAGRFNGVYGPTLTLPEPFIPKAEQGARIMSLQDPTKKMSKSDPNPKAFISILDEPGVILKKFRSAVTDSEARVACAPGKEGINNLMGLYSVLTGKDFAAIEEEFAGRGYGDFKTAVGEAVVQELAPVQARYKELMADKGYLEECYRRGAQQAMALSRRTIEKVYRRVGFLQP